MHEHFQPLPPGFVNVENNDIEAIKQATTDKTCAVLLEPVQAEGGVNVADDDFLKKVREWCDSRGILLILDEVQTGIGRLGALFGWRWAFALLALVGLVVGVMALKLPRPKIEAEPLRNGRGGWPSLLDSGLCRAGGSCAFPGCWSPAGDAAGKSPVYDMFPQYSGVAQPGLPPRVKEHSPR